MRFALLALLLSGAGCATTAFEATDPTYRPIARARDPEVFDRGPPARPYTEVGRITVKDPPNPQQAIERAVEKARQVGCELLVARRRGGAGGLEPLGGRTGTVGGKIGSHPGTTIGADEPASRDAVFVCGVYSSSS